MSLMVKHLMGKKTILKMHLAMKKKVQLSFVSEALHFLKILHLEFAFNIHDYIVPDSPRVFTYTSVSMSDVTICPYKSARLECVCLQKNEHTPETVFLVRLETSKERAHS